MSRRHLARAVILGLILNLAAQSAWARPQQAQEEYGSVWGLVIQLWHSFTANWSDEGCWIDPNGDCGSASAPASLPQTDVGCIIDPNGACRDGG